MNIQSTHAAQRADVSPANASAVPTAALLPAPTTSVDGLDDALAMMTALAEKQRGANEKSAKMDISKRHDTQARLRQEAFEQREKAREAESAGGVFKAITVIGSIAATAATLGTAAPAALALTAAALSASSMIVSETKCFGEDSGAVALALGCGAGVVTGGSAMLGLAGTTSTALQATAKSVDAGGKAMNFAGTVGSTVSDRVAATHDIAAMAAQFKTKRENNDIDQCIAALKDLGTSHERTVSLLHETRAIHQQTSFSIAQTKV